MKKTKRTIKEFIFMFSFVSVGLIVTSCGLTKEAQSNEIEGIRHHHVLAPKYIDYEIDFSNRVEVVVERRLKRDETSKDLEEEASFELIKKSGSDFIFQPLYSVETKGNSIRVTGSGYPGFYTGTIPIEDPNESDPDLYKFNLMYSGGSNPTENLRELERVNKKQRKQRTGIKGK